MSLSTSLTNIHHNDKELLCFILKDNTQLIDKILPQFQSLKLLLQYKLPSYDCTIIEMLLKNNCVSIIQTLVLKHRSTFVNYRTTRIKNILHMALEENQCSCFLVKLIISNFKSENYSKDSDGNSEMHKWVMHHSKCEKCIKTLSSQSIELSTYLTLENNNHINPLELAAAEGNESACQLLIKYFHFDYEHVDKMNETILHKVARSNLMTIVDFVMSKLILQCSNTLNETCLTIALSKGNFHMAEYFIDKGIKVTNEDKIIADSINDIPFSLAKKIRLKKIDTSTNRNAKFLRSASSQLSIRQRLFTDRSDPLLNYIMKSKGSDEITSSKNGICNEKEVSDFIENCKSPENKLKSKLSENSINFEDKSKPVLNHKTSIKFAPTTRKRNSQLTTNMKKKPLHKTFTNLTSSNFIKRNKSTEDKQLKKNNSYHDNGRERSSNNKPSNYTLYLSFEHIPSFYTLNYDDIIINKTNILHYSDHCFIYKGVYLSIQVAIKVYRLDKMLPNELKLLNNEIVLSINLRHPHIVSFIGYCIKDNILLLVTEYLEHNSLKNVLENTLITLSQKDKLRLILEIAQGIYYLHKRNPIVFHRDLKSSNVLIDKHLTAKLCDFGLSKTIDHLSQAMKTNSQSTPYWMAPEFILEGTFTDKSDIYSFGILIWEIIMRDTLPYKNNNMLDFILGNKEVLKQRPIIPDDLSNTDFNESINQLTTQCWDNNPNQRPSIDVIVTKLEKILNSNSNSNNNSVQ